MKDLFKQKILEEERIPVKSINTYDLHISNEILRKSKEYYQ